jgi:hypothetical protein
LNGAVKEKRVAVGPKAAYFHANTVVGAGLAMPWPLQFFGHGT